jgi:hypothetical protein
MKISPDTLEIINFLNTIKEGQIRKSNDLATILEIAASFNEIDLIDKIIFSGAYIWNLNQTIRRNPEIEGIVQLHTEMRKSIEEVREMLIKLLDLSEDDDKKRFNEIYFPMTSGAVKNLIDLSHDLSALKELQNTLKNK